MVLSAKIPDGDLDVYDRQNFGNQSGFGMAPALLIVDFVNGFANPDEFGGGNIGRPILPPPNSSGLANPLTKSTISSAGAMPKPL